MLQPLPTSVTNALAWVLIGLFLSSWAVEVRRRNLARALGGIAWGGFGIFWLLLVPRFALVMRSPIETVLSAIAVPICLSAGYLLWRGHHPRLQDSLFVLTRSIAVMGVLYMPFETFELLRRIAIESVAHQAYLAISWLGYNVTLTEGPDFGYQSALIFSTGDHKYMTHIVLACTGLGSMTIFAGVIAALDAPLSRKVRAAGLAVGIIYVLNLIRNVFIAVAFGDQWFQVLIDPILLVSGYADPALVSFFIADRVLSQSLSVVALVALTWLMVKMLPELLSVIEDALFVITRTEYDLHGTFASDAGGR